MYGWMGWQIVRCMGGWTRRCMDVWVDGRADRQMHEQMEWQTDAWTDRLSDRQLHGQMVWDKDRCMSRWTSK